MRLHPHVEAPYERSHKVSTEVSIKMGGSFFTYSWSFFAYS